MLAAAFCPHAGATLPQAVLAEEHSGCHAKTEQAEEHHSGSRQSNSVEAMHGMKAEQMPAPRFHVDRSNIAALTLPAGTCAHCVSHNETPQTPASARGLTLQKRDAGKTIVQTTRTPVSLSMIFTTQFAPTQHAPPGITNRRHILLSVFLI
jgi:hypothetical protein